jgi:hypothetical protein
VLLSPHIRTPVLITIFVANKEQRRLTVDELVKIF